MHARGLRDHVESIWSHETDLVPSDPHHGSLHFRWADKDRKSTRLNSSHSQISYAVFCLKKKNTTMVLTVLVPLGSVARCWFVVLPPVSFEPQLVDISEDCAALPGLFIWRSHVIRELPRP